MYIEDFESFYQQAEALYRSRPLETRYCIKYRNCDGVLALKVTDDVKCLQYKTDQQSDLRKLERINNLFMALAAGGCPGHPSSEGGYQHVEICASHTTGPSISATLGLIA
eukprot:1156383-Pelagomonas_calceolata.AAC.3